MDKKIRILIYGMSSDKFGGIETYLLTLNSNIYDRVVFDYVIEGEETIVEDDIKKYGGEIYYISPKRNAVSNMRDWLLLLKTNRGRWKYVYFNLYSMAWIAPVFICKFFKAKIIIHAHNNNLHNCGTLQRALHQFNRGIQKFMRVSRFTNSELSRVFFFGSKKACIIHNAIDLQRFRFDESYRVDERTRLNLLDNTVYGFVGRLAYQKNPMFLMEIFRKIQQIDSKAAFVVFGEGEYLSDMERFAVDNAMNVQFMGNCKDIERAYCALDVFLLPSRFEGLGIVLIEAQAAGLPCLTSKDVVPKEAKVTDLVEYISLEENAAVWAKKAVEAAYMTRLSRVQYNDLLKDGDYDIKREINVFLQYILEEK